MKYTFHVNHNERGEFFADVRNPDGQTIFEIRCGYGEDADTHTGDEVLDLFKSILGRFVFSDLSKLRAELLSFRLVAADDTLVMEGGSR